MQPSSSTSCFEPGRNCFRTARAAHATPLIDCADFYRALHRAIVKARRSLFILGWEIDSGTRLLRGADESASSEPSVIVDLLLWKARRDPNFQIYLLRWDSSVAFAAERELAPEYAWTATAPSNLHLHLDDDVPLGGSHHQKIVLIDDELVFSGGMDIARQRWDERAHRLNEPERNDVDGAYGPYHDVQILMDGPIVASFAELVRRRWKDATGSDPAPPSSAVSSLRAAAWPEKFPPIFRDLPCAIARTIPAQMEGDIGIREVEHMLLDLIGTARDFIYIENQFLTSVRIARALNRRLREQASLRALLVSSYDPQGLFEREGMWAARIDFKRLLQEDISPRRVRLVSSAAADAQGRLHHKRIHSKILVIDDRVLVVGSANLSRRSMRLDTECDVILAAERPEHLRQIARARNDLIAEHAGLTVDEIGSRIERGDSLCSLMGSRRPGRYALHEINDSRFTDQTLQPVVQSLADPARPLFNLPPSIRNPSRALIGGALALISAVVIGVLIFAFRDRAPAWNAKAIEAFLEDWRHSPWAFPAVCLAYVAGGFVLFPVTILSLITAAVFGPFWGPTYAMGGALLSASSTFAIGRFAGAKGVRRFFGRRAHAMDAILRRAGFLGVAILRMIPIAPFTFVNLAMGMSSLRYLHFVVGTFLGFLPAFIAKGLLGHSLLESVLHPGMRARWLLATGLVLWGLLMLNSYILARRWWKRKRA